MKEFLTAVEEVETDDKREAGILALMEAEEGLSREVAEKRWDEDNEPYAEFKIDGRVLRAYRPTDGQLAFMLASLGRGQTSDQRFAAIINIMMETLRDSDQDYLESRLLTRDKKRRLGLPTLEGIFEHLTEEWFREESDVSGGS